jgi:hypothetical protein
VRHVGERRRAGPPGEIPPPQGAAPSDEALVVGEREPLDLVEIAGCAPKGDAPPEIQDASRLGPASRPEVDGEQVVVRVREGGVARDHLAHLGARDFDVAPHQRSAVEQLFGVQEACIGISGRHRHRGLQAGDPALDVGFEQRLDERAIERPEPAAVLLVEGAEVELRRQALPAPDVGQAPARQREGGVLPDGDLIVPRGELPSVARERRLALEERLERAERHGRQVGQCGIERLQLRRHRPEQLHADRVGQRGERPDAAVELGQRPPRALLVVDRQSNAQAVAPPGEETVGGPVRLEIPGRVRAVHGAALPLPVSHHFPPGCPLEPGQIIERVLHDVGDGEAQRIRAEVARALEREQRDLPGNGPRRGQAEPAGRVRPECPDAEARGCQGRAADRHGR